MTESDSLVVGTLYIVTCTGSTIGREKSDISIADINVSKVRKKNMAGNGEISKETKGNCIIYVFSC